MTNDFKSKKTDYVVIVVLGVPVTILLLAVVVIIYQLINPLVEQPEPLVSTDKQTGEQVAVPGNEFLTEKSGKNDKDVAAATASSSGNEQMATQGVKNEDKSNEKVDELVTNRTWSEFNQKVLELEQERMVIATVLLQKLSNQPHDFSTVLMEEALNSKPPVDTPPASTSLVTEPLVSQPTWVVLGKKLIELEKLRESITTTLVKKKKG